MREESEEIMEPMSQQRHEDAGYGSSASNVAQHENNIFSIIPILHMERLIILSGKCNRYYIS